MGKDEEKKGGPLTSWVLGYYGDDAIDLSKKTKIKHLLRTGEFASMIYVISKNSKKAHTDFFEEKYDTLDVMYAKAAAIIVKLLKIKYSEGRPLTQKDFDNCGGAEMFAGRQNYAEICEDYIGPGGMVEMCDISCVPRPEVEQLLEGKETKKDYKNLPQDEKDRRIIKKMAVLYGGFVEDLDEVRGHHSELLKVVGSNNGTLKIPEIIEIFKATKDKGDKMFQDKKGRISALDFDIMDDYDKSFEIHYETAKKTGKLALLGGVAAASLGCVAGGVFWPAFVLLPVYALGKQWLPDWFKALGKEWGHLEKTMGHKFESRKYKAQHRYMVSFLETNGHPKIRLLDRPFLSKAVRKCLNKGCKSGLDTVSFEGSDGEFHRSAVDSHITHTSENLATYIEGGDLVAVDNVPVLQDRIKKITPENATFEEFEKLAKRIEVASNITTDEKYDLKKLYAQKFKECAQALIFERKMESMTQFQDVVNPSLSDNSPIMKLLNEMPGEGTLPFVTRLKTLASKELTGLNAANWKNESLLEFIRRKDDKKLPDEEFAGMKFDNATQTWWGGFNNPGDPNLVNALSVIKSLRVLEDDKQENAVVGPNGEDIKVVNALIAEIGDAGDKNKCNKLLQKHMGNLFYNASRVYSRKTFEILKDGLFAGKLVDLTKFFTTIGEMTYADVLDKKYDDLIFDITGTTKIDPPEIGRYLRVKLGKAANDAFTKYLTPETIANLSTDIKELTTFLKKVSLCQYLTDAQRADLTAKVSQCVSLSVEKYANKMASTANGALFSTYNRGEITALINNKYGDKDPGFEELFASDNSTEIQATKQKLETLQGLNGPVDRLKKIKGYYEMTANDQKIIGAILVFDGSTNYKKMKVRDGNDALVNFINNKLIVGVRCPDLTGATAGPSGDIEARIQRGNGGVNPYQSISSSLDIIKNTNPDGMFANSDFYDRYAALIALKNVAAAELRASLKQLISNNKVTGVREETWLLDPTGTALYKATTLAWEPLFKDIDEAIENLKNDERNRISTIPNISDADKLAMLARFNKSIDIRSTTLAEEIARQLDADSLDLSKNGNLSPEK